MTYKEACALLEVSTSANLEEIEKSYSIKIKFYSPENFRDDEDKLAYAERTTKKLNEAWEYVKENYEKANTPVKANAKDPNKKPKKKGSWAPVIAIFATVLAIVLLIAIAQTINNKPETPPEPDGPKVDENGNVLPPEFDFMGADLSAIVNLGQYKGNTIEVAPKVELTEEYFNEQIRLEIIGYGQYNEVKEGTVKETDVIKIKYVGYKDGEKFEGGEGTKEFFTVYDGGGFIEGFAEGIIGAEVGKEIDVNVTFPEDYHAEELAGKPAVFKVTVEFIYEAKEMTDELVKELSEGKMETYAEFKEQAWKLMEENIELEYKTAKLTATWKLILETSKEIKLPEDTLQQYIDYNVDYYQQYATYYGMTLETFLASQGITREEIEEGAREEFFYECVLFSIIKTENITISDEDFDKFLKEMMDYNDVDEETIYDYYTKEDLTEMFLMTKGYESVLEWNTYVDKAPETDK